MIKTSADHGEINFLKSLTQIERHLNLPNPVVSHKISGLQNHKELPSLSTIEQIMTVGDIFYNKI